MTPLTLSVFVLGLMIIVVASFFVAAPLFHAALVEAPPAPGDERERLERQKRQALMAIREAELDYQMGKLSDEDLTTMRGRFEAQALEAMAALEKDKR